MSKKPKSNRGLIVTFGIIIVLLLAVLIIVVIGSSPDNSKKAQTRSSSSSESATTAQPKTRQNKTTKSKNSNYQLADLSQSAVEDPDTRTNGGDITYSQFYLDSTDHHWYWSFSSSKRGQVENARVSHVAKSGSNYTIGLTSERYEPGTPYQLVVQWLNSSHTKYNLRTDFKRINGNYTLGDEAFADYSQVNNTSTTEDVNDWLTGMANGDAEELPGTRTNDGEVTNSEFYHSSGSWYWLLEGTKQGVIAEAQITSGSVSEDGDSAKLNAVSMSYPNYHTRFTINMTMSDNGDWYTLQTGFQSIYGKYKFVGEN